MAKMAEGSKPPPRESAQPEKRFPQRYTVVEHHPSGASSIASAAAGSSSSRSTAIKRAAADTGNSSNSNNSNNQNHAAGRQSNTEDDAQRFSKNSLAMEERAKRDLRDTLLWVGHLSGGPVDRRLLREAVSINFYHAYAYLKKGASCNGAPRDLLGIVSLRMANK